MPYVLGYLKMDLSLDKTESLLSNKESLKDFLDLNLGKLVLLLKKF